MSALSDNPTRELCIDLVVRLGYWRNDVSTSEERVRRTARIQHAMGAFRLMAVPDSKLRDVRDALHALIVEVGA